MHNLTTVQALQGTAHHLSLRRGSGALRKVKDQTTAPDIQRKFELAAAKFHPRSIEIWLVDHLAKSVGGAGGCEGRRVGGRFDASLDMYLYWCHKGQLLKRVITTGSSPSRPELSPSNTIDTPCHKRMF
jgi:hypothetical protein